MATKLRSLYERRKGQDLFDVWHVFKEDLVPLDLVINIFIKYCANDDIKISREVFQKNMELKKLNKGFQIDMHTFLSHEIEWNFEEAFHFVQNPVISRFQ